MTAAADKDTGEHQVVLELLAGELRANREETTKGFGAMVAAQSDLGRKVDRVGIAGILAAAVVVVVVVALFLGRGLDIRAGVIHATTTAATPAPPPPPPTPTSVTVE